MTIDQIIPRRDTNTYSYSIQYSTNYIGDSIGSDYVPLYAGRPQGGDLITTNNGNALLYKLPFYDMQYSWSIKKLWRLFASYIGYNLLPSLFNAKEVIYQIHRGMIVRRRYQIDTPSPIIEVPIGEQISMNLDAIPQVDVSTVMQAFNTTGIMSISPTTSEVTYDVYGNVVPYIAPITRIPEVTPIQYNETPKILLVLAIKKKYVWDFDINNPSYNKMCLLIDPEFKNNPIYTTFFKKLEKEYINVCMDAGIEILYTNNIKEYCFNTPAIPNFSTMEDINRFTSSLNEIVEHYPQYQPPSSWNNALFNQTIH